MFLLLIEFIILVVGFLENCTFVPGKGIRLFLKVMPVQALSIAVLTFFYELHIYKDCHLYIDHLCNKC